MLAETGLKNANERPIARLGPAQLAREGRAGAALPPEAENVAGCGGLGFGFGLPGDSNPAYSRGGSRRAADQRWVVARRCSETEAAAP